MAWIEQTGKCCWRVRYPRPDGGNGSVSGFGSRKAARDYADDLESDRRRGQWLDPDGAKTTVAAWAVRWVETLDVETRTEENYRAYLRNHILPHWQHAPLGQITALAVTAWIKTLRQRYAASTVAGMPALPSDDVPVNSANNIRTIAWRCTVPLRGISAHGGSSISGRRVC